MVELEGGAKKRGPTRSVVKKAVAKKPVAKKTAPKVKKGGYEEEDD